MENYKIILFEKVESRNDPLEGDRVMCLFYIIDIVCINIRSQSKKLEFKKIKSFKARLIDRRFVESVNAFKNLYSSAFNLFTASN